MSGMNLLGVEALCVVVQLGSLQAAAKRHGVSPATISRRLTQLEDELGARLIERTTRSLRVTELGRAFHERCTSGLEAIVAAGELVASQRERVGGVVRISTPPDVAPLLLPALADMRRRHPLVHVVLVETERRLDQRRDAIDLFLRVGAVEDERLVARPLGTYPHVLVASEAYLARRGTPTRPEELATHDLIAFGSRTGPTPVELSSTARRGRSLRVTLTPILATNNYGTILAAARADLGIAEVPAFLQRGSADLVRVLPTWTLGEVSLRLLFASDRMLSKTVRTVLDAIATSVPSRLSAKR
jgi:DNA-binding transcriptional LysR family regulator